MAVIESVDIGHNQKELLMIMKGNRRLLALLLRVAVAVVSLASVGAGVASAAAPVPVWATATAVGLPVGAGANATTAAGQQDERLLAITCTSPGSCVAVGQYVDTNGTDDDQAMVATETAGAWAAPVKVVLPSGANNSAGDQDAKLDSVACTSQGYCVAGGDYTDTHGSADDQAMVVTETDGMWAAATKLTLPSGANGNSGGQEAGVNGMSCTSIGNCVVVGTYADGTESDQAMYATETNGAWGSATELTLPTGADSTAASQAAFLNSVVCTTARNCVAVGEYSDAAGHDQPMAATETSGAWAQAAELTIPANHDTSFQDANLYSLSCTGPGDCVAVGYYDDSSNSFQAMAITEANGAWTQATEIALPSNENTSTGAQNASLNSVTCTSPGNCVAGGAYRPSGSDFEAMTDIESGGFWAQATEVTSPTSGEATLSEQESQISGVTCTSLGYCVAVGSYADSTDSEQAMVLNSVASLAVSTTSLAAAVIGSAYSATPAVTGGTGHDTWSIGGGSLPSGLTLNSATGVISGTPTLAGTASFVISAADAGPPAQQASMALSITVAPALAALAMPRLSVTGIKLAGISVGVTVKCAGAATQNCGGVLSVTTIEHLFGPKVRAVTARAKPKKSTKTVRTVKLGTVHFSLAGGGHKTLSITLNKTGQKLLARYRKLPAKLVLTSAGAPKSSLTKTITFKPKAVKRKHR